MTDLTRTHLTLVCDRSGSMMSRQADAEGAVRHFIKDQASQPGSCELLLVDFDDSEPYRVVHEGPIGQCPDYELRPRGNTPLFDALGRAITATGERLAKIPEDQRPASVVFVYQTDGQENASQDWTKQRVSEAIKRQQDDYQWVFVALGVGADAANEAQALGITNIIRTGQSGQATAGAYAATSHDISSFRSRTVASQGYDHTTPQVDDTTP